MKRKSFFCILILLAVLIQVPARAHAADGSSVVYEGYSYDFFINMKENPAAFVLERTVTQENLGDIPLSSVDDVCTSDDGRIFIIDTLESRLNVLDAETEFITSIKLLRTAEGKIALDEQGNQIMLQNPEGVYIHEKESEIYIADTGAERIVVLDLESYTMKRVIGRPDGLSETTLFKPSKITVDMADRIYVVIQSSYEGIVELTREGVFSGFYGVNVPVVSFFDYFWKSIASDEQKAQISKTYAPAFNNITLDNEGFVMAVTYDSAAQDMVFRLNSKGENVLREPENALVIGDYFILDSSDPGSQFVDIAVTDFGTYAVMDRTKGRIFLYNFDGELLNVFGSNGNLKGQFKQPVSIAWQGNKLLAADKTLKCVYVLTPTSFGQAVLDGNESYYFGRWDEALEHFEKAVSLNANYEVAYSGIGKNYLMKEDYETAMYYFKLGNNREFYSKAYNGYRGEWMEKNFWIIAVLIVLLVVSTVWSEIRYHKYGGKKKPDKAKRLHAGKGGEAV